MRGKDCSHIGGRFTLCIFGAITMSVFVSLLGLAAIVQDADQKVSDHNSAGLQTRKLLLEGKTTGAYASGGNAATALPGATSLAGGAATTFKSFSTALNACTSWAPSCDVYFNFHTNYSFGYNAGDMLRVPRLALRTYARACLGRMSSC